MTTYTARSFEKAQFAHHPDGRVAARINDHEYPWAGLNVGGARENFGDGEMARKGWVPVQEAEADEVDLSGEMLRIAKEHQAVINRAEKAEQERDEAEEAKRYAIRSADTYRKAWEACRDMTAREHLDAAWEAAHVPEGNIPEGADYITRWDDGRMAYRKAESPYLASWEVDIYGDRSERRLLDPPAPSRPEGAEGVESQIEQWLYDEGPDDPIKARDLRSLADFLAERGVRVVTEDER